MRVIKGLVATGMVALFAVMVVIMVSWSMANAGSEGDPNVVPNSQAVARAVSFGPVLIVDGVTGNHPSDGTTVDANGLTHATFYMIDRGGTSVVTPQVSPDDGTTWLPLTAATLSGTTSSVEVYPALDGDVLLRLSVTSCSSCNVDVWWAGQRLD